MRGDVRSLVDFIQNLTLSHESNASIRGSNHLIDAMLELKKTTAQKIDATDEWLNSVEGKALSAQAVNAIGDTDLKTIQLKIDTIREEL